MIISTSEYAARFLFFIKETLEFAGIVIIIAAAVRSIFDYAKDSFNSKITDRLRTSKLRVKLGRGIISGLEIIIAADVISSTIDQTYTSIGILILTVVLRITLGFFLTKDIKSIDIKDLNKIESDS